MNMLNRLTILIGLVLVSCLVSAQHRLNFGLFQPQSDSLRPKTQFTGQVLQPKWSSDTSIIISLSPNKQLFLSQGWRLTSDSAWTIQRLSNKGESTNQNLSITASVPGTVLQNLVQANHFPDPYYHLNNLGIPESLNKNRWWYQLKFQVQSIPTNYLVWLQSGGINYQATFWLNGQSIGEIKGAFKRGNFNISTLLKKGLNELVICIDPPPNPGIPHEQSKLAGMGPNGGQMCMDGPTFLSAEGWDWVPGIRDRNMGLWQPVSLYTTGSVTCEDPQIITDLPLPDTTSVDLSFRVPLQNHTGQSKSVEVSVEVNQIKVKQSVLLQPFESKTIFFNPSTDPSLHWIHPKLWWPNGMGPQTLYNASIQVKDQHGLTDIDSIRFGVREFGYELTAKTDFDSAWRFLYEPTHANEQALQFDNTKKYKRADQIAIPYLAISPATPGFTALPKEGDNPYLIIRINGERVFCKGGNWGMDDGMKQISRSRLEPAFALHRDMHFNMVRNWTGESTEPVFFELADEYGMLVWNDFWMSTEGYNLPPNDQRLWLENSLDVIKRYRNHPSIAIWCPRNEGYAPEGIEKALAAQIQQEDGTRHYIGNSREINLRQSGPWHYFENPSLYVQQQANGFTTEIGTFAIPTASTIRKFIHPSEQWPISDAWHYHDLHSNNQNLDGYLATIDQRFGKSKSLDEFCKKAQMINYDSHRAIFEAWNSKRWNHASGVLLWMSHPAWPSMIWQTYSYDFETPGGYFGAKKACEPLHIQWQAETGLVEVINSTRTEETITAKIELFDILGKRISEQLWNLTAPANQRKSVGQFILQKESHGSRLVRLSLYSLNGERLSLNEYWIENTKSKSLIELAEMAQPTLKASLIKNADGKLEYQIKNTGKAIAVGLKCYLLNAEKKPILPAYWSDGYFNLLPGEARTLQVESSLKQKSYFVDIEGLNVNRQTLTK